MLQTVSLRVAWKLFPPLGDNCQRGDSSWQPFRERPWVFEWCWNTFPSSIQGPGGRKRKGCASRNQANNLCFLLCVCVCVSISTSISIHTYTYIHTHLCVQNTSEFMRSQIQIMTLILYFKKTHQVLYCLAGNRRRNERTEYCLFTSTRIRSRE